MAKDLIQKNKELSIYDFVMLFEMLDEGRTGMISARNLRNFLETAHRMKVAQLDLKEYNIQKSANTAITEEFDRVEFDLEDLVAEFDLTGDRLISPEEFYNIIMAYYE
jgi:Ca2+-binding EF-hand superfamily protein